MAKIKTVVYTLPAFWACALINGDESGFSDEESEALQAWIDRENVGACVAVGESPFFDAFHDARAFVLPCECLDFKFLRG